MRKIWSVIRYEYKMQFQRPAAWGIFLASVLLCQFDNFPSAENLARLEFLGQPAYFVYRVMSFDVLVLAFGLLFLMAGRIPLDQKTGVKSLMMACPLEKWQYISGKLLGSFLYTFSMLCIFLTLNTGIYFAGSLTAVETGVSLHLSDCLIPLLKCFAFCAVPVSMFVSFSAAALPGIMDIRLVYILAAVLFGFNASYVGSAGSMPFWLITAGDLVRLIWVHPRWTFTDMGSVLANGIFLIGGGMLLGGLLFLKWGFWRER